MVDLPREAALLAASTNKKVLVERFDRETVAGYVNPQLFRQPEGLEVLTVAGAVLRVPVSETKVVHFVRDLDQEPIEAGKRRFITRPKSSGLWVRLEFRDGDWIEGLMANDLAHLEAEGFSAVPPDSFANSQRLWVPRQALRSLEVLGVIGSPLRRRKPVAPSEQQIRMFD